MAQSFADIELSSNVFKRKEGITVFMENKMDFNCGEDLKEFTETRLKFLVRCVLYENNPMFREKDFWSQLSGGYETDKIC